MNIEPLTLTAQEKADMFHEGTPEARDKLVRAFVPMVRGFVNSLCSGTSLERDEAEGAALEGVAVALDTFDPGQPGDGVRVRHLGGWVQHHVRGYLLNHFNRHHLPWAVGALPVHDADVPGEYDGEQEAIAVARSMLDRADLTSPERTVVQLYALSGLSQRGDITEAMDMPYRKVRRLWESAQGKLLALL